MFLKKLLTLWRATSGNTYEYPLAAGVTTHWSRSTLKLNTAELKGSRGSGYGPPPSPGNARSPGSRGGVAWSAPIEDWANVVETTIRMGSIAAIDRMARFFRDWLLRVSMIVWLTATLTSAPTS